jgi:hypothetical protein
MLHDPGTMAEFSDLVRVRTGAHYRTTNAVATVWILDTQITETPPYEIEWRPLRVLPCPCTQ